MANLLMRLRLFLVSARIGLSVNYNRLYCKTNRTGGVYEIH